MIAVDAHHHFWDPTRASYPWMTDELAAIRRPFGPEDLRPLLAANGIDRTILVQTRSSEDETREFPKGKAEILNIGGGAVGRLIFQPGWRWSRDVKPLAKTKSCEAPHFQYHVSGRLAILMDDGKEFVAGPGDVTALPSGHDAWVVGDEPAVVVDWCGASEYGKTA